jgi:peptidoglycan/LPS O-acetylase OafA/YrhL
MNTARLYQLDLLRFLAAISVVGFHYFHMGPFFGFYVAPSETLGAVARYGYLGVQAFFMISGFVIAMSAEGRSAGAFLRGRATRLLPLFWVACVLTFLVTTWSGKPGLKVSGSSLLASLAMLPAVTHRFAWVDGVYWTLAFEWLFYAIVAVSLATGIFEKHLNRLLFGWLVVSIVMLGSENSRWLVRFFTVAEYAPYFVAGICLYRLHARNARFAELFNLALSFLLAIKWSQKHVTEFQTIYSLSEPVVTALVCALFAMFLLFATGRLEWLNRKAFGMLGGFTYALYLTHQNIGYVALSRMPHLSSTHGPAMWVVCAVLLGALILACALHLFVEKPLSLRLRAKRDVALPPASAPPRWKQSPTLDKMSFD